MDAEVPPGSAPATSFVGKGFQRSGIPGTLSDSLRVAKHSVSRDLDRVSRLKSAGCTHTGWTHIRQGLSDNGRRPRRQGGPSVEMKPQDARRRQWPCLGLENDIGVPQSASTASPEGGRPIAQGVSPGTSTPTSPEPRQGRQTFLPQPKGFAGSNSIPCLFSKAIHSSSKLRSRWCSSWF
jgi:hypothetical protein